MIRSRSIVSVLVALSMAGGVCGQERGVSIGTPPAAVSGGGYGDGREYTSTARCMIKVTFDPAVLPLAPEVLNHLVVTNAVVEPAAKKALSEEDAAANRYWITFEAFQAAGRMSRGGVLKGVGTLHADRPTPTGDQDLLMEMGHLVGTYLNPGQNTLYGSLHVHAFEHASELMAAVCEQLQKVLVDAHAASLEQVKKQLIQWRQLEEKTFTEYQSAQKRYRALIQENWMAGQSHERVADQIRHLREREQGLMIALVGFEARQKVLQERIAEVSKRVQEESAAAHPRIEAIKARVELLKKELERERNHVKIRTNKADILTNIAVIEVQLVEAVANLDEAKQIVAREAGAGELDELNRQLADVAMQITERRAALKYIEEQWAKARDSLDAVEKLEGFNFELPICRSRWQVARFQVERLIHQLEMSQPPSVTILVGTEGKKDDKKQEE